MITDPGLFQLRRHLLLPRRSEARNLLVPSCPSASHVHFSSVRMEPQFMLLGHAAGVLAALAHAALAPVQDVPAADLHAALLREACRCAAQH